MPISEKDIFASLMQDPNHAYNPLEKVWAEAQQRARQFRNNEKALALAFGDSPALEKLFDYLDTNVPLTKAIERDSLEDNIREHSDDLDQMITQLGKYVLSYNDAPPGSYEKLEDDLSDLPPHEGWNKMWEGVMEEDLMSGPEGMRRLPLWRIDDRRGNVFTPARNVTNYSPQHIYEIGSNLAAILSPLLIIQKIIGDNQNLQEGLSSLIDAAGGQWETPEGRQEYIDGTLNAWKTLFKTSGPDVGEFQDGFKNIANSWVEHPIVQQHHDMIVESRGGDERELPTINVPGPSSEDDAPPEGGAAGQRGLPEPVHPPRHNEELRQQVERLTEREQAEFMDSIGRLGTSSVEEILDGDSTAAFNIIGHAMDMQGMSAGAKDDAVNAWGEMGNPAQESPAEELEPIYETSAADPEPTSDNINLVPPASPEAAPEAPPASEPFSGNVKEGYEKFAPQTLNDENEAFTVLYPTIDGEEFKPFDNVGNNNQSEEYHETVKKLVQEYVDIHEGNSETPHLGWETPYFPGVGSTGSNWKFKPEDFNAPQKKAYNKLNANKAIIEEYLRVLFSAGEGHVDSSNQPFVREWNDHRTREQREPPEDVQRRGDTGQSFNQQMGDHTRALLPEEERTATAVRMNLIPHPGAWDWYQLLNTMQGLSSRLVPADEEADDYRDANDNPSFHLIPQSNFSRLGYPPTHRALESFSTLLEKRVLEQDAEMEGDEDSTSGPLAMGFDRNQMRLAQLRVERKKAENPDDEAYANFSVSGRDRQRNHFREAWEVFTAGKERGDIDPGEAFMDWLGMSEGFDSTNALWRQIPGHPAGRNWVDEFVPPPAAEGVEEVVEEIPETEEQAAARIAEAERVRLAQEQADREQAEADRVAEIRRAEAEAERTAVRESKINSMIDTQKLLGDFEEGEEEEHRNHLNGLDDKAFDGQYTRHMELRRKHRIDEKKQRDKNEADAAKEAAKPTGKSERTPAEFEKLKEDFKRVYERVHGRKVNEDAFNSWASDYDTLDKEYKQALKVEHDRNNKEHQSVLEGNANKVGLAGGIDKLPDAPTKDDLLHQVRQIQMWKYQHGPYMTDKDAKETLKQLEIEAYQKANNAGIDLESFNDKDEADAKEQNLAYGSAEWFKKVGDVHIKEQMKGARYRRQIQQGGELRANSNYKPWLVIQYDRDGNGTLLDLRTQQEVRKEDLKFDKENPGFDYTGSETPPEFADPESSFWENLDYANLRPINTDEAGRRTAMRPPAIGHSPLRGTQHAWYHPESKSWINSHRYYDAQDEINASAPGSGMLINLGSGYHGKNQGSNKQRHYGFQATGEGIPGSEKSYYLDGKGNIAHIDPDAAHVKSSPDFSQPQTVNSAIHDWHLMHVTEQAKANPGWGTENNQPKTHVIMSPQQQQGPTPLQNAVQEGDALYRRRQQGKLVNRRKFDTLSSDELGQDPTYYGKRGRMQMLTPRTATEKVKQGFIGTVGYTESGVLTGLAKLLLNTGNIATLGLFGLGWGQEQNNIKRQRANYNRQAKLQRNVKQHMETVTDNGRQRAYISPGEQQARIEDHKNLKESLSTKQQLAQNRARDLRNAGDREGGAKAEADSIRFQALKQGIDKRKIENPADWEHINTLYEQHYGSPQVQATLAPAIGEQPSQNLADRFQPLPQQPSQPGETYPMMYDETPSQPKELVPNWS